MAKSKSFFGLRKGSTKTMTYSVLKGQQITKDRVTDIANPRTMDQTLQRIPFAQAVKFYKQATRGLFRFAFEDKKPLESDYNAFMRHNVKYASSVSLDNYRNSSYPSIGNYLLSAGSLPGAECFINDDKMGFYVADATTSVSTVGGLSTLILKYYPNLSAGDIVTLVSVSTRVGSNGVLSDNIPPAFNIKQFVIDESDTTALSTLNIENIASGGEACYFNTFDTDYASAFGVVFSRNTPAGLKVSDSHLIGSEIWVNILENKLTLQSREGDAYSWGATDKAILQGAVADESRIQ